MSSVHVDTFARDHLPPISQQPEFLFELPELQYPDLMNCATELLDRHIREGRGQRICIQAPGVRWTYAELQDKANRIANVLVEEMGLVPGNRVLLRASNTPMLAACWFAVMKAGGIAVTTMPLLRAKELREIIEKAQLRHALCDSRLAEELSRASSESGASIQTSFFNGSSEEGLEASMRSRSPEFRNVETAADDTCLLAFTSGTTGIPKATMHFHRDVMSICACWCAQVLRPECEDVFIGSPPLAFTFGLGGLLLFPMSVGASTVLLENVAPESLLQAIEDYGVTLLFTAPTAYRSMAAHGDALRKTRLRRCVSAGEALPAATRALWKASTGIEIIDGIGATELLHIFISADEKDARAGATGLPVPGYRACVLADDGSPAAPGAVGRLAVKGPTGCRYLADERQKVYVQNGWNITGDAYSMDTDGYFYYHARTDDMIISAGYNIAAPEVEDALLQHPAVLECGVIGAADVARGQIVKAFVVAAPGYTPSASLTAELQDFVKKAIAPYKYPRAIAYCERLPRTQTGKLQRFRLLDMRQELYEF